MEAPEQIIAQRSRFGDAIDESLRRTAESLIDLLCGVLAELHGIPDDRTIGDGDLVASGFDPSSQWPDELDYW
jgi:hypothetical protein